MVLKREREKKLIKENEKSLLLPIYVNITDIVPNILYSVGRFN